MTQEITASASVGALVRLTGILGLRPRQDGDPPVCTFEDDVATWRLNHGIVVTCKTTPTGAHWAIEVEDA